MKKNKIKKHHKINEEIRLLTVKLVGDEFKGEEYNINEALNLAREKELDLVLINEQNKICKIISYSKMLYELNKNNKIQKSSTLKEVKFSYSISEHDISYRIEQIKQFLKDKHKVKLSMMFRGREMMFKDMGKEVLLKVVVALEEYGIAENLPTQEGKLLYLILKPKK